MAARPISTIQATAKMNSAPMGRWRRTGSALATSSRSSSSTAMADPRIEHGVEQVDDEVHQYEARGHEQHDALQDDEVAGVDGADQEPADARQGEDGLYDQGTADQAADVDA